MRCPCRPYGGAMGFFERIAAHMAVFGMLMGLIVAFLHSIIWLCREDFVMSSGRNHALNNGGNRLLKA